MKIIYLPTLLAIVGCSPQTQPQFNGPASLLVVPPSYYSTRPPISRKRSLQVPAQAEPEPAKPRYFYPEPGKPVIMEGPPTQVEEKLDEAADKLYRIRQRLNQKRPAFGTVPEPPQEAPEAKE